MATIREIAEACGVSAATVSKALNNSRSIGPKTAGRIRETARSMGYFPNAAARALKTNRSYNIGVLLEESGRRGSMIGGFVHEFFAQVMNSFQAQAEKNGYDVTFLTRNIGGAEMTYVEHCRYRNCDGALIAGADFSDPYVLELLKSGIPCVTIDHIHEAHSAVLSDNVRSMRGLVGHAWSKGHRKIAFITGQRKLTVTKLRLEGFIQSCRELGIPIKEEYIIEGVFHDPDASAAATKKLLALEDRPTCIFYPDDFAYIGGHNEIEAAGLKIPDDISVAGFDGIYLSQVFRPRLTTLKQDTEILGAQAADLLVRAMRGQEPSAPEHILIPGAILEGETVKNIF